MLLLIKFDLQATCKLLTDLDTYRQPVLTFAGGDSMQDDSTPKRANDIDFLDEETPNDDDDYFDFENIQTDTIRFTDMQKPKKATFGHKAYNGSYQVLGSSSTPSEGIHRTRYCNFCST